MNNAQGRNLIFMATGLLLLAGSLHLFVERYESRDRSPAVMMTQGKAVQVCDRNAVQLDTRRIGCRAPAGQPQQAVRRLNLGGGSSGGVNILSVQR